MGPMADLLSSLTTRRVKKRDFALLKTEAYRSLTVAEAIERFAPSIENDVPAYTRFIGNECKVGPETLLSSIVAEELERFAAAMLHRTV